MKKCKSCNKTKPFSEFYISKNRNYTDAIYYYGNCKECTQKIRNGKQPTKEEKIKKWNEEFKKVWSMGKWLKKKK